MVNFLALLGWSLDGETTIIDRETLCSKFTLDRITKKDAIFDQTKLEWMNGQYIQRMGADEWVAASRPWLVQAGASEADIDARPNGTPSSTRWCPSACSASTRCPRSSPTCFGAPMSPSWTRSQ